MAGNNRYNHLTDEELLAAYRSSRDNSWLGHLLQRYTTLLLGVALKYLKDGDKSEDAVQQVFLKTLTHLPEGEIGNFKGWLYVLMRNHCLQELRDSILATGTDTLSYVAAEPDNHDEIRSKEYNLEQMMESLELLNVEQKITIKLFYLEKQSYEQIIIQTGYTFMQVKSFIQNGKRNLKTILLKKTGELANGRK